MIEIACSGDPDAGTVAALRAGDHAAFGVLFARHAATLERLARRHVRTDAQAEDVVQQTWLAVLEGIDGFEGRARFRTWLCTILVHTARRQAGRDGRALPFTDVFADDAVDDVPARRRQVLIGTGGPTGPAEAVLAGEARSGMWRAIGALPPRQRAVLVLVDVEGRAPAEVCDRLGLTPGNLRLLLHRARAQVRRTWRPLAG